ncbi:MAG: hypothetical protein U0R64_09225 [Candidatus Nanopelagicales bacterium]
MNPTLRITVTAAAVVALTAGALPAGIAQAKGNRNDVRVTGDCSARTDWKLKAKARDGGLEIEFEVDSNRIGQRWSYRLDHDGNTIGQGTRRTLAPSGSFSVERRSSGSTGVVTGRAENLRNGEVCLATLRV